MLCQIHQCEMKEYSKDGQSWNSHKLENGAWCTGKEKKGYSPSQALQSTALAQIQASQARVEARLDKMAEIIKDILSKLPQN